MIATDYSEFTANGWQNNENFDLDAGEYIIKNFSMENLAETFPINAVITLSAYHDFLDTGDCKIWILDEDDDELAEDEVVTSDELKTTYSFNNIPADSSRTGKWKIQCSPDFNETVAIEVEMETTSQFQFDD